MALSILDFHIVELYYMCYFLISMLHLPWCFQGSFIFYHGLVSCFCLFIFFKNSCENLGRKSDVEVKRERREREFIFTETSPPAIYYMPLIVWAGWGHGLIAGLPYVQWLPNDLICQHCLAWFEMWSPEPKLVIKSSSRIFTTRQKE